MDIKKLKTGGLHVIQSSNIIVLFDDLEFNEPGYNEMALVKKEGQLAATVFDCEATQLKDYWEQVNKG